MNIQLGGTGRYTYGNNFNNTMYCTVTSLDEN